MAPNSLLTYKLFSNLPKIPLNLEDEALDLLEKKLKEDKFFSHSSEDSIRRSQRTMIIDGAQYNSTRSQRLPLSEKFINWFSINIAKNFVNHGITITQSYAPVHGAHTDHTRLYTLLYLLKSGGENVATSFYQEEGEPVVRKTKLNLYVSDYERLSKIDTVIIPERTWCILNVDILHDVKFLTSNRIAFQIGFDEFPNFEQ